MYNQEKFYDDILESLKIEAKSINDKLKIASGTKTQDYQTYIILLKALKEIMELISRYEAKKPLKVPMNECLEDLSKAWKFYSEVDKRKESVKIMGDKPKSHFMSFMDNYCKE